MDNKKAKQILSDRLHGEHDAFSSDKLEFISWYLCVESGNKTAALDGDFTADDLEAIAAWMRNPIDVAES